MLKRVLTVIAAIIFTSQSAFAGDVWINNLRKTFANNSAIIYEINIRTFNANDANKNGIIDFAEGEESGNFINAIDRLDELAQKGINTIHVLPITPVGKTKALGTAGSLYSSSGFDSINPQLISLTSSLSPQNQVIKFVNEAHKRGIALIVDLPSCGSYDLYLKRPELFVKDKSNQPVIPSDWTDVRLLNAGSETSINSEVFNLYKKFVDMAINLGFDGIRADVATSKPAKFWQELISYSRKKDPQFLWLAEAFDKGESVSEYTVFTPYNKLLESGFDGYYGSFVNFKDFKSGKELTNLVSSTVNALSNYPDKKAVIGSFVTHDEMSPILVNGPKLSEMIIWLNATLPVNSYFVDGFDTGDSYLYMWGNKEAIKTYTDDDIYFVHRGKIDIFNFSRKPGGNNMELLSNFILANGIKKQLVTLINSGKFVPLKTKSQSVFAYAIGHDGKSLVVIGNLDFKNNVETKISVRKLTKDTSVLPLKIDSVPIADRGKFIVNLKAGEVLVLLLNNLEVK